MYPNFYLQCDLIMENVDDNIFHNQIRFSCHFVVSSINKNILYFQFDVLPDCIEKDKAQPGDLVFISGKYYNEKSIEFEIIFKNLYCEIYNFLNFFYSYYNLSLAYYKL